MPASLSDRILTCSFILGIVMVLYRPAELNPYKLINSYIPSMEYIQDYFTMDCRCMPDEPCWPSTEDWKDLNRTLNGRLVKTVPIASVCHHDGPGKYDAAACAKLRDNWGFPETHIDSSSSVMGAYFANMSCDPFTEPDDQCVIGAYVQYAVNVHEASDVQTALDFVTKRNLRVTIRNTGHDYYGKATGTGAVAIWTRHLRDTQVIDYNSEYYQGKALKMGAGVTTIEAYKAAHAKGLVVVGGNCPSVGIAGGYTMGGGHGPLATRHGLAADQVLEWEVVTGDGKIVTATPTQHAELYWAMGGGGGGIFGVALSLTVKAHPDEKTTAESFTLLESELGHDTFWAAIKAFVANLPALMDSGAVSIWLLIPGVFMVAPTTAPGLDKAGLQAVMKPVYDKYEELGIKLKTNVETYPTYLDSYLAQNQPYNISNINMGGRLIPRSVVEKKTDKLIDAIKQISNAGAVFSGVSFYTPEREGVAPNSVNPDMRDSVFDAVIGLPYDLTNLHENTQRQLRVKYELMEILEFLTPGGGAYLSESDFRTTLFTQKFYGDYVMLRNIKDIYDPNNIFYTLTGVGAERFHEDWLVGGRLCKFKPLANTVAVDAWRAAAEIDPHDLP